MELVIVASLDLTLNYERTVINTDVRRSRTGEAAKHEYEYRNCVKHGADLALAFAKIAWMRTKQNLAAEEAGAASLPASAKMMASASLSDMCGIPMLGPL